MDNNQILKLENLFNSLLNREVKLAFAGCLESSLIINSFKYLLNLDLLTIIDSSNNYYFKFNINQVYNVSFEKDKIVFYLDYDVNVTILY
jgi:hypothetical protein